MSEFIKTAEVIGKGLRFAQKLGQTMLEPFKGGWANLGKATDPEPKPAQLTFRREDDGEF